MSTHGHCQNGTESTMDSKRRINPVTMHTRPPIRVLRRFAGSDCGQGVAEFAIALPVILMILLGMVEFANAYDRVHGLAGLSREGANIAARGTALSEVMTVVMTNGQSLEVPSRGGAVISRITVQGGIPTVESQLASEGYEDASRLTDADEAAKWIQEAGLSEGSTHYTVELFLTYEPVTPVASFIGVAPSQLYERALF